MIVGWFVTWLTFVSSHDRLYGESWSWPPQVDRPGRSIGRVIYPAERILSFDCQHHAIRFESSLVSYLTAFNHYMVQPIEVQRIYVGFNNLEYVRSSIDWAPRGLGSWYTTMLAMFLRPAAIKAQCWFSLVTPWQRRTEDRQGHGPKVLPSKLCLLVL